MSTGTIVLWFGMPCLFALIAAPLWRGWVPMNAFYGYRTPATMENDDRWYAANHLAGRNLLFAAGTQLLVSAGAVACFDENFLGGSGTYLASGSQLLTLLIAVGITVKQFKSRLRA